MSDRPSVAETGGQGRLAENIAHFARALRAAGLPVGPGSVLDAVAAVEAARVGDRSDFYWSLHAVFVKKHEHSEIFQQAFRIFWRRKGMIEKIIASMSPRSPAAPGQEEKKPEAGALRVAEALLQSGREEDEPRQQDMEVSARLTVSEREVLQGKDFAQMTAAEIARAQRAITDLKLPDDEVRTRRMVAAVRGRRIDPRRSFRRSLRGGGAVIELAFHERALRHPPIVALCDISGSMSDYTRLFLHFLHTLTEQRRRVHTFLFGTRLTNVTRSLKSRDPDEALARCSAQVQDWSGGTRIGTCLHQFNREWSRRVLGQGAVVLLFTDGLERDGSAGLPREMERLHHSCRRLVWLNPLLRFDGFEAKAQGIRAMLPHVDEFRPIHNLASMEALALALAEDESGEADPRKWLKRVG
ncbi:VWA domain-containing protein [Alsobacter sp. SYSU M60028]|uniref:VWA domain-containing protein n=1 Tax=Alsobacter ponti TaxID=2962936 RepID=A0ABT1LG89_9HYPH|nr:VWA domain-containing protein [Alsobacter ponti]MCP8940449.1 VWA domain-containing protein [Alsobacter ponti]